MVRRALPARGRWGLRRGGRPRWGRLVPLCLLVLLACGREAPRSLLELERMAFVPAGRADGGIGFGWGLSHPAGADRDLLVDLFEATRSDYAHWMGRPLDPGDLRGDAAFTGPERGAWPAYGSAQEAEQFAAARGMRLLTVGEWLYVASGPRGQRYPWGRLWQSSLCNSLELGLGRPLPVGTFENGRSPFGCYDMVGNAAEWVVGSAPNLLDHEGRLGDGATYSVMGGSFLRHQRPLYDIDRRLGVAAYASEGLDPRTRSPEFGFRAAVEAELYLRTHARHWGGQRARLGAVGQRWGSAAVPLLTRLRDEPGAATAIAWLLEGARR